MSNGKQLKNNFQINFDDWAILAKDNPDEFEEKRREHIELFIKNVPKNKQHRLKGLQWQIDQTRKLAHSPMASCIAISNMMWDSVERLNECQHELTNFTSGIRQQNNKPEKVCAVILPMQTRAQ